MLKIALPRRNLLPRFWRFPEICLPRVRVDFPEKVTPPWQEIEVERVIFTQIKPGWFIFKVIFGQPGLKGGQGED